MKKKLKRIVAVMLAAILFGSVAAPAMAVMPDYKVTKAYAGSRYYRELLEVELTGNYRADLVNVALSQVGYHEGENAKDRDGMHMGNDKNWTEYGYYCECDGFAWCAMFVSWCARQAQIPKSLIDNSRVARSYVFGVPFKARGEHIPATGDIVFFVEPGQVLRKNRSPTMYTVSRRWTRLFQFWISASSISSMDLKGRSQWRMTLACPRCKSAV